VDLARGPLSAAWLRLGAALRRLAGAGVRYSGAYRSWEEASAAARGWDRTNILEGVAAAVAKVERGEAVSERDSITLDHFDYSFPVMAALLKASLESAGAISVLDFGGSLGSSYRQFRAFAPAVGVQWHVVEQENFVHRGKSEFETAGLRFFLTPEEAASRSHPQVVLLSGVLQFLENPYETLIRLSAIGSRYLILDRTPFSALAEDRLTVQRVPPAIYEASYACRIFSHARMMSSLPDWNLLADFASPDGWAVAGGLCFRYGGMLLQRKP
jgi:putative methyltransferase (TIGR04325 family)